MARNAEKAQTMLNRFMEMKAVELGLKKEDERRPFHTNDCDNLAEAEKWRRQVIRDTSKRVSQIQNAGLGEFRIRELNDEINKLLREKKHWEDRIKQLGGPDYRKTGPKMLDSEGLEIPGQKGYKYFGAAKDLPGVRELFEVALQDDKNKHRTVPAKRVDADYYGYRDDDDQILIPLEEAMELKHRDTLGVPAERENATAKTGSTQETPESMDSLGTLNKYFHSSTPVPLKDSVEIPLPIHVERFLLEKRKQALLDRIIR